MALPHHCYIHVHKSDFMCTRTTTQQSVYEAQLYWRCIFDCTQFWCKTELWDCWRYSQSMPWGFGSSQCPKDEGKGRSQEGPGVAMIEKMRDAIASETGNAIATPSRTGSASLREEGRVADTLGAEGGRTPRKYLSRDGTSAILSSRFPVCQ